MSNNLRSATGGRGNFYVIDHVFERNPRSLARKGDKTDQGQERVEGIMPKLV